jgi:hypothetical protein
MELPKEALVVRADKESAPKRTSIKSLSPSRFLRVYALEAFWQVSECNDGRMAR